MPDSQVLCAEKRDFLQVSLPSSLPLVTHPHIYSSIYDWSVPDLSHLIFESHIIQKAYLRPEQNKFWRVLSIFRFDLFKFIVPFVQVYKKNGPTGPT